VVELPEVEVFETTSPAKSYLTDSSKVALFAVSPRFYKFIEDPDPVELLPDPEV
jgi:hypothetical protein